MVRVGISTVSIGYAKYRNKFLQLYDPNKPTSYIIYLDANNLNRIPILNTLLG